MTPDDRTAAEQKLDRNIDDPEYGVGAQEMAAAKNRTLGEALREGLRRRGHNPARLTGTEAQSRTSGDAS